MSKDAQLFVLLSKTERVDFIVHLVERGSLPGRGIIFTYVSLIEQRADIIRVYTKRPGASTSLDGFFPRDNVSAILRSWAWRDEETSNV